MMRWLREYAAALLTLAVGLAVWVFWWMGHPEILCYHEQNQMFLWTWDYLLNDLSISGGLADYLGECIVQFYYLPWLGGLLLGLLFAAMTWTSWGVIRSFSAADLSLKWLPLSLVVPVLMLLVMGDIEVLLGLHVAVAMALAMAWVMNKRRVAWWVDIFTVAILFWLIGGGATWLYVAIRIGFFASRREWISVVLVPWVVIVTAGAYRTAMAQYPLEDVMVGVGYYRVPCHHPFNKIGFNVYLCNTLKFNTLERNEDWNGVIALARKYQAKSEFTSQCVNLALGIKRQLADQMFSFFQSGEDALIGPRIRNNTSMYPTMDAFWHLGMVNECLRYAFDLQEGILSNKGSGRLTMRIAQCNIANGDYAVARMHLELLKKTTFYRSWALETEKLLWNETLISRDREIGRARRFRFKNDFLFSYDEIEKVLGNLFINNVDNKLALDYFMGDMLLKGQIREFYKFMSWVEQYGGYTTMPLGYQDALNCMKNQNNLPDSPYGNFARKMISRHDATTGATKRKQ